MHLNPAARKVAAAAVWTGDVFVREVLVLLAHHGFKWIPPPVREMLEAHFHGWLQSAVCENGNGACRDQERESRCATMSRLCRYERPHRAEVIKSFGRTEVSIGGLHAADRQGGRRLADTCFSAVGGGDPSIGKEPLARILAHRTWPSQTPEVEEASVSAWVLLQHVAETDSWSALHSAWKAAVVPEMTIVHHKDSVSFHLVLYSSVWGWLVWPVDAAGRAEGSDAWAHPQLWPGNQVGWPSFREVSS